MEKVLVILPVYNESECLDKIFDSVLEFCQKNHCYRFLFVNDGSTDNTQQILERKIVDAKNINISVVSYSSNRGKGYAIKKGVEYGQEDYICFLDGDLAYSLVHLEILVAHLNFFDIVIGCRNLIPPSLKQVKLTRLVAGKAFNIISRKVLSLNFSDMQAGIKGFRKEVAQDLFSQQSLRGFGFDVELIVRIVLSKWVKYPRTA
ncbi:MAG: glycosyltransferase family 2 protein [Cyanobacteriota bacterium]